MLERFFVKPQTVVRIMDSWLGPQIEQYVKALCERAYTPRSIHRRVPVLVKFAAFTAGQNVERIEQAERLFEPFIADWLSNRHPDRSADARRRDRNFVTGVLRHFFSLVVWKEGDDRTRPSLPDPFAVQVPGFFDYLRDERGLRQSSIAHYRHYLRVFERHLGDIGCDPKSLTLPVVTAFITTQASHFRPHRDDQSRQRPADLPAIPASGTRPSARHQQACRDTSALSAGRYPSID